MRKRDSGYRAFHAFLSKTDGVTDIFSECPDEGQILDLLKRDDALSMYGKRDRLLAESDIKYLAGQLEKYAPLSAGAAAPAKRLSNSKPEIANVTAICWANGESKPCPSAWAYHMHFAIKHCAVGVVKQPA